MFTPIWIIFFIFNLIILVLFFIELNVSLHKRNKLKKFLKYFAILLLGIVVTLLIIPSFISLDSYKNLMIDQVKEVTGRELKINGDIAFSLLPTPTIKIKGITLSSVEGHSDSLVDVKEINASLSLFSLIKGNINISSINIYEPIINLQYLKNGSASWDLSPKRAGSWESSDLPPDVSNQPLPVEFHKKPTDQFAFSIGSIKLVNGKVNYLDLRNNGKNNTTLPMTVEIDNLEIKNFQGPGNIACQFYSSGKNYSLEGKISQKQGAKNQRITTITANLDILKEKLIFLGDLEHDNMSFSGKLNLGGNAKNLQEILPAIKILSNQDYALASNIKGDKQSVVLSEINFSSGKILASGHADFIIKDNQLDLKLKLNPGDIDISVSPIKGYNSINEKLSIAGTSLKPLLTELAIDIKDIPAKLLTQSFDVSASIMYRDQDLSLNDINLKIAKESSKGANLKGDLGIKNWHKNMLVTYNLQVNEIADLASLFVITLPVNVEHAILKGETSKEENLIKTNNSLIFAKITNNIKGVISLGESIKPNLTIESSGANLGAALQELTNSSSNKSLGNYSLLAQLQGDIAKSIKINIDRFAVDFKGHNTVLSGDVDINLISPKPEVSADIKITSLNLNGLAATSLSDNAAAGNKVSQGSTNVVPNNGLPWSKENIDLAFLKQCNGKLTLNIQKIVKGDLVFDNIKTILSLSNGILNIKTLNGKLFGGDLEATGQISSGKEQAVNFTAKLQKADLRNIIKQQGKIKVTKGLVNFATDIKTSGQSQWQYVNNLMGNATLTALEGSISGFDLQKTLNAFKKTRNLEDILKTLDLSFSGGETSFQNLIIAMEIKKGIANIVQGKLEASQSELTASGYIDLPKYSCDVESQVALDIKKSLPPFKVRFYGSLNNIQHKLDTKLLQQYLLQNALSEVMDGAATGKKPAEILKNLIGIGKDKGSDESQNNQEPSPPNNNNPVEDLKTIGKELKGLFK